MFKRLILLLLFSLSFASFGQNAVRVIDNKGTVVYVDPSKWFQVAGNLYNKNTSGNVAIGLDTSITDLGARLVVSNGGSTTLPALILKSPFVGVVTDDVLTWNSTDGSVTKKDRVSLVAEPWYKVGTTTGATLNTDDVFIKGSANVGVIAPVTVASAGPKTLSKFAVAGGDAAINTVTVGLGGGQVSTNLAVGYQALYDNNNFFNGSFNNTAIGYQSLILNTAGNNNIAVGFSTLNHNSNGSNNIAIGSSALTASTGGLRNSAIGIGALKALNGGNDNIGIGYNAGNNQTGGSENIIIGNNINVPSLTTGKQMNIGNAIFGLNIGTTPGGAFVGIGTTAPTNLLEIKAGAGGSGKSGLRFTNLTSTSPVTAGATTIGVDANGDVVATDATANAWKLTGNTGTSTTTNFLGTTDNNDLVIKTNNTENLRVSAGGNVGIGATAPAAKLEVNSGTANTSGLRFTQLNAASTPSVAYNSKVLTVNATGDVGLTTVPGTETIVDFSVNTDPNLEGTTFFPYQPQDNDVVYISTIDYSSWIWNGTTYIASTPSSTAWLQGGNTLSSMKPLGTRNAYDLPIVTNSMERMRITSNGYVAINNTYPYTALDVNGNIYTSFHLSLDHHHALEKGSRFIGHKSGNTTDGFTGMELQVLGIAEGAAVNNVSRIHFNTWGNSISANRRVMTINEYGNVGIGTTSPTAKLDVNGTVNATNYTSPVQTVTDGAWDLSKGSNAKWVLAAGVNTLTLSNMKAGMYGTIIVTNTGTSTITFGGGTTNKVINGGGGVVMLTPIDKAVDILSFMYDGEYFWWTIGNNYN